MFVPILGWLVAAHLECRRRLPWFRDIEQQIRDRTEPTLGTWGDDPERRAVATVVCEELQREFGWPNDHFLPEDPLRLLIWRTSCDAELLFALVAVERRLGVRPDLPANIDPTLADLVETLVRARR